LLVKGGGEWGKGMKWRKLEPGASPSENLKDKGVSTAGAIFGSKACS